MMTYTVLIAGTYSATERYPNVKHRIALIASDKELCVKEFNANLRNYLNYQSRFSLVYSAFSMACSIGFGTLKVILAIVRNRSLDTLYIPYPAIHILWLLSFIPRSLHPKNIVADIFISIYDTSVNDRRLLRCSSLVAKALFLFERRALNQASTLVTDTVENSRFLSALFEVELDRFKDIPLSIADFNAAEVAEVAEARFNQSANKSRKLQVLFVGTLVPLHGIELICDAFEQLPDELPIEFLIVGDGQQAPVLEAFTQRQTARNQGKSFSWIKQWQDEDSINKMIQDADICLGIFGSTEKSQRVWPFKNYHYLACGRPLITGATPVSKRLLESAFQEPFYVVSTQSSHPLVEILTKLVLFPDELVRMRKDAREYFEAQLSSKIIRPMLRSTLITSGSAGRIQRN